MKKFKNLLFKYKLLFAVSLIILSVTAVVITKRYLNYNSIFIDILMGVFTTIGSGTALNLLYILFFKDEEKEVLDEIINNKLAYYIPGLIEGEIKHEKVVGVKVAYGLKDIAIPNYVVNITEVKLIFIGFNFSFLTQNHFWDKLDSDCNIKILLLDPLSDAFRNREAMREKQKKVLDHDFDAKKYKHLTEYNNRKSKKSNSKESYADKVIENYTQLYKDISKKRFKNIEVEYYDEYPAFIYISVGNNVGSSVVWTTPIWNTGSIKEQPFLIMNDVDAVYFKSLNNNFDELWFKNKSKKLNSIEDLRVMADNIAKEYIEDITVLS